MNNLFKSVSEENPVIAWWSGGLTSAVTCWLCIQWFGIEQVRVIMIDTKNEDPDTYRFKSDCEKWYGCKIEAISRTDFKNIREVWRHYKSLNVANGAICSAVLKREVRINFQKTNTFSYQAFGYDTSEMKRAVAMKLNYPESKPFFPLIIEMVSKRASINIIESFGIEIPEAYRLGLNNNNCLQTGCVQGGIGYWQLMKVIKPEVFDEMAEEEHYLTNIKGQPVTMLKDQSKTNPGLVFLKPHPAYPEIKDISQLKGRPPKPLMDCSGFCGVGDVGGNDTIKELNLFDE